MEKIYILLKNPKINLLTFETMSYDKLLQTVDKCQRISRKSNLKVYINNHYMKSRIKKNLYEGRKYDLNNF